MVWSVTRWNVWGYHIFCYTIWNKEKSNRQNKWGCFFLNQVYTCGSGCWNHQMSTRYVSSIQYFTGVCDFLFVTFWAALFIIIYVKCKVNPPPPCYYIVIWNWFNLLYNIHVKFRIIFIWSITAAHCHPQVRLGVRYVIIFLYVQFWIRLGTVSYRGKKVRTVDSPAVRSVNKSRDTRNSAQNEPKYAICVFVATRL